MWVEGYQNYLETFYSSVIKHGNSPYPLNPNVLSPTDDVVRYFEEKGPLPLSGSYTRILGGTTMHWEGKSLRMLPDDFTGQLPIKSFGSTTAKQSTRLGLLEMQQNKGS